MKAAYPAFIIIQSQGCVWILQYNCCQFMIGRRFNKPTAIMVGIQH